MNRTWRQAWRSTFASVGFRLALNYGLLAIFTMLVLMSVFYIQTVGVLHQGNVRLIEGAAQRAMYQFEYGGRSAVEDLIRQLLSDSDDAEIELYLLLDESGNAIAGNLAAPPGPEVRPSRVIEQPIMHRGRSTRALLLARPLPDGAMLILGRDLRDQDRIESLVQRATVAAAMIALLLVIGGTFWFRSALEDRVEAIRLTAARIGAGELDRRVPLSEEDDEFARLNRDINAMLDRIEGLMEGVRHVSNTIAHDLRTPLTRIQSALLTADRPGTSLEDIREANRQAVREIASLTVIFDKLLQIAEAEAGTRRQHFRPTEVGQIVADVVDLYGAVAEERDTALVQATESSLTVLGDRDLLAGAVANLVDNALKHTGAGTRIRIGAGQANRDVLLTIEDDGPGVPQAALERLGDRFFRVDSGAPGVGLGLSSVRAIVQLHSGSIRFDDAAPGLRISIRLPALVYPDQQDLSKP